jgi:hypothetical protein
VAVDAVRRVLVVVADLLHHVPHVVRHEQQDRDVGVAQSARRISRVRATCLRVPVPSPASALPPALAYCATGLLQRRKWLAWPLPPTRRDARPPYLM